MRDVGVADRHKSVPSSSKPAPPHDFFNGIQTKRTWDGNIHLSSETLGPFHTWLLTDQAMPAGSSVAKG
jgi:hypothetical protein